MNITYKEIHEFSAEDLEDLFLSVEWSSGHYPKKLAAAMRNYETVFSAWDGEKLVGLTAAMDDGVMTAYVHYLLVRPEYQRMGIGKRLLKTVGEKYADFLRIVLSAHNNELRFYEACGFTKSDKYATMFITSLWT